MTPNDFHIGDWELEQFLLGELPETRLREIEREVAQNASLKARIAALKASNEEILSRYTPEMVARSVASKAARLARSEEPRRGWSWWRLLPVAASMAMILMVAAVAYLANLKPFGDPTETIQTKGLEAHLRIYRQTDAGPERLAPEEKAEAGDRLQIRYVAAQAAYGVIVSLDGRGSVTRHFPPHGKQAGKLETGGEIALPHGYELDEAPHFERFFIVTSAKPFEVQTVIDAARKLGQAQRKADETKLVLPDGLAQSSFLLKK
ncbi:MAG: ActD-like protein [Myxococcales bacterium]|nr:MAG: ActD-like protein [Myxococcales bacterium]